MYRLRDPHWFSHTTRHDKVTTDKTMTRESATSGHTRQLPPGDKTKEKQTRHATKTNQKTKSRKRLSQTFCYFFFFPRLRVLLIHFERKIAFFFSNSFQSSVGNKPSSKCDNLTKDKQDTRNKTWTHSIVVTGKKKYVYTEREGTKNQLHARRQ